MTNQQKEQTPTFVVVLPLGTDDQTKWQLGLATEVARLIYNATAGFGHKQLRLLRELKTLSVNLPITVARIWIGASWGIMLLNGLVSKFG